MCPAIHPESPATHAKGYGMPGPRNLRAIILALVLVLTRTDLNPPATICGLLTVQAGIYIWKFFLGKEEGYEQKA